MNLQTLRNKALYISLLLIAALSIIASGGGGGGGNAGPTGGAQPGAGTPSGSQPPSLTAISGTVRAPGGNLAFYPPPDLIEKAFALCASSVYAAVSGTTFVPNGTVVELVSIDDAGNQISTLATTTVSNGRYSFDVAPLGLTPSSRLVVQVRNQNSDAKMRAFVTAGSVNIDPVSEAIVRTVLEKVAATHGATLAAFTPQEIADLVAGIDLLTTLRHAAAGGDLESTVTTVKNILSGDAGVMAFINSAAAPGQTTEGPGDVGNYFPTAQRYGWNVNVTVVETGKSTVQYADSLEITGTKAIDGVEATVLNQSNPSNTQRPQENYLLKNSAGVTLYGNNDSADTQTPQLVPYRLLRFPLAAGSSFEQMNKTGLDFGRDLDGDGVSERYTVNSVVTVAGFESVVLAAGTFSNTARIETRITLTVTSSRYGTSVVETVMDTVW